MELLPGAGHTLDELEGIAITMRIASKPINRGGLQCAFRVLADVDYGIDAHIEFTVKTDAQLRATGRILSLQIKSGPSYFSHATQDHWRVYIAKSTVNYWRHHSLPVLLVIVDTTTERAFWVRGDADHLETDNNYAIDVPKINEFNQSSWSALWGMASSSDAISDFFVRGRFEMALPWLLAMHNGESIVVDVQMLANDAPNRKRITLRYRLGADELASSSYYPDQEALERSTVLEFDDLCNQATEYDPPLDPEVSGVGDFESWVHKTYFDHDEEMFSRWLPTGDLGFTFALKLNERGEKLIELFSE
ncbi:MAG: DUF4365 domain-containing protein [Desulfurivibrionaceae bacterium]